MSIRMIMEDALSRWLVGNAGLSDAAVRVRLAMRDLRPRSLEEIALVAGMKPHTARRAVAELVELGWLHDLKPLGKRPRLIGAVFPQDVERQMEEKVRLAYTCSSFQGEWLMRSKLDLL